VQEIASKFVVLSQTARRVKIASKAIASLLNAHPWQLSVDPMVVAPSPMQV
tara:strand:+ start:294 stop:446 length:153 start_codon:yes stop_codon:yes gene_type:complete